MLRAGPTDECSIGSCPGLAKGVGPVSHGVAADGRPLRARRPCEQAEVGMHGGREAAQPPLRVARFAAEEQLVHVRPTTSAAVEEVARAWAIA